MQVAVLSTFPPAKCGIAEYTYDLVTAVMQVSQKLDFTIFRLTVVEGDTSENYPLPKYAEIVNVGVASQPNYKKILEEISKRGKFEVLHIQHEYSIHPRDEKFIQFLRDVRKYCYRVIITLHNVRHPLHYPGIDEYQRKICENVDVVIVHSVLQEVELVHQGVNPDKIVRIPHGTRLIEHRVSKSDAARELGLEDLVNKQVLLVQGFLRRDKGLHVIVRALDILVNKMKFDNVVLLVAGQIQDAAKNQQYVEEMMREFQRFGQHVVLLNRYLSRKELDLVYALSDVIVFPYVDVTGDIGVSGAFHWALGSFKPLVCSRVPRLVEFYELAPRLTFPPHNPEALAAKVRLVLTNYNEVLQYLKPVFEYAIETSWINLAKIYVRLYSGEEPYMIDIHVDKLRLREETEEKTILAKAHARR